MHLYDSSANETASNFHQLAKHKPMPHCPIDFDLPVFRFHPAVCFELLNYGALFSV